MNSAWNFDKINQAYRNHLRVLGERPAGKLTESNGAKALREWATRERQAWEYAVTSDPLLPDCLLPPGYLGREAWKRRNKTFAEAARQIKSFHS